MTEQKRNARIVATFLGVEDHGLFVLTLMLDYGDSQQGYSRIVGDDVRRLRDLLEVLGAESWEALPGRYCRAVGTEQGITRLGHVMRDRWTKEGEPADSEGSARDDLG